MNKVNLSILIPSVFLTIIGLSVFYSIDIQIFRQQLFFLVVSLVCYFIFLYFDYNFITYFSKQIYIFILIILVALLMMFMYGFSMFYFMFFGVLSALLFPLLFRLLHEYQRNRILSYLNY